MDIEGRVAVVTGGASGIGAATAEQLRRLGATVVSWDLGGKADIICDVSSLAEVEKAMARTVEVAGVPTILVHSAGIASRSPITDLDVDSWERTMAINARGSFICLGVAARAMIEQAVDQGSIVLLSSTAATLSDAGVAAYGASKAAVTHLARIAAVELGGHNIRVNAILPGPTETPLTRRSLASDEYRAAVIATTPLRRVGTPELLSNAIVHTLQMDWVTGQIITADGGTSLVTPRGTLRASIVGKIKAGETTELLS